MTIQTKTLYEALLKEAEIGLAVCLLKRAGKECPELEEELKSAKAARRKAELSANRRAV